MDSMTETVVRTILVGAGATAVMDAWLMLLKRLGVPTLNFAFIGRWVGNGPDFRWAREGIAKAPPVRGELWLGWLVHYATGVLFAGLLVAVCGSGWIGDPTLMPAVLIGVATVAVPLLVMQPAMGAGIASSRTAAPLRNCIRSLAGHTVFGLGLYLAALAVANVF